MKGIIKYTLVILIIIMFIIAVYAFKMAELGMSVKSTVTFIVMFFAVFFIAGGLVKLFTRGVRKKLDNELNSYEDNNLKE